MPANGRLMQSGECSVNAGDLCLVQCGIANGEWCNLHYERHDR